ncbi:MAG: CBS domain-containing protein [Desulfomonilaceae bacterium]
MPRPPVNDGGLSQSELNIIKRHNHLYNGIEDFMRDALDKDPEEVAYSRLVDLYFPHPRDKETKKTVQFFKAVGRLRNGLVHSPRRNSQYIAIPTKETVRRLEECYFQLVGSGLATAAFPNPVETIRPDHSLAYVLDRIHKTKFSQFPVYGDDGFSGLLTENGIVQWLADNLFLGGAAVEFEEVPVERIFLDRTLVQNLLGKQETPENVMFVENTVTVEDVRRLFVLQRLLEACLITENGRSEEDLLAIVTRWDVTGV